MKKGYLSIIILILVLIGVALLWAFMRVEDSAQETISLPPRPTSPENATYRIDDREVTLTDGYARIETAPGSVSALETQIVGTPLVGDFNDDLLQDSALILTQSGGGSGTFYYFAVAFADGEGAVQGSNALFLGDRVSVDDVASEDGMLIVSYRTHGDEQAMAEEPSVEKTLYVTISGATISGTENSTEVRRSYEGTYVYADDTRTFTTCAGDTYDISNTSRARAALETIYMVRARDKEPLTPVYITILGTIKDTSDDEASEASPEIDVESILSAPEIGECSSTPSPTLDE